MPEIKKKSAEGVDDELICGRWKLFCNKTNACVHKCPDSSRIESCPKDRPFCLR